MPVSEDYLAYVLEQMRLVRGVTTRKMFGALCLFHQAKAFALIDEDVLYLKVDDSNRGNFVAAGMSAFTPDANKPEYKMNYFEVPIDVLEEPEALREWAKKAIAVANKAALKKRKKA
ncbi:MAG TPA: TfoX/Sxy family protein [bacterium]|jgi:DNA transformation protein